MRGLLVAIVPSGHDRICLVHDSTASAPPAAEGTPSQLLAMVRELDARSARWVWWDRHVVGGLVAAGARLSRVWDLSEAHRLLMGGWSADPDAVWAVAQGLSTDQLPARRTGDLFDEPDDGHDGLVRPDGYLHADVAGGDPPPADRAAQWGQLALTAARGQANLLAERGPRALATAASESGAALLTAELEHTGLPVDRPRLEELIAASAGARPESDSDAIAARRSRDAAVLRHTPGRESVDLRNPAQVLALLQAVGVHVTDTRAGHLEAYRLTHPVVDALLTWRKAERIATTYGWSWLDRHVGPDARLRGPWTSCDGGAGRMTAGAGLHSLPTPLRPAVAAEPGRVLVRADLGQVEPRVLAVVSGDRALAEATRADDLYSDVAEEIRVDRPTAKIAMLAAMYGQTSGSAGAALAGMKRSYPTAIGFLDRAATAGEQGQAVTTYGGRRINVRRPVNGDQARAMGRFTRNAVVQGAAAELFKAWALTVRAALHAQGDGDGRIVLMLHDELLLDVAQEQADDTVALVHDTLQRAARLWSDGAPVRFVADVAIVRRWSEAKG